MLKLAVDVPEEFVTVIEKVVEVATALGVPEINPVDVEKVRPVRPESASDGEIA